MAYHGIYFLIRTLFNILSIKSISIMTSIAPVSLNDIETHGSTSENMLAMCKLHHEDVGKKYL